VEGLSGQVELNKEPKKVEDDADIDEDNSEDS